MQCNDFNFNKSGETQGPVQELPAGATVSFVSLFLFEGKRNNIHIHINTFHFLRSTTLLGGTIELYYIYLKKT